VFRNEYRLLGLAEMVKTAAYRLFHFVNHCFDSRSGARSWWSEKLAWCRCFFDSAFRVYENRDDHFFSEVFDGKTEICYVVSQRAVAFAVARFFGIWID